MSIERELLDFCEGLHWSQLPLDVRRAVIALSADAIANAVAGRTANDCIFRRLLYTRSD